MPAARKGFMKKKTIGFALALLFAGSPAVMADEFGLPTLNTAGRYLGVGWSHHTYHSRVDGRYDVITNRHPACAYPSSALSSFYSPEYTNFPPRPESHSQGIGFWRTPTITQLPADATKRDDSILSESSRPGAATGPKLAPQLNREELAPPKVNVRPVDPPKPKEPPPSWLKPYLDSEKNKSDSELIELEPSPNDGKHAMSPGAANRYRR